MANNSNLPRTRDSITATEFANRSHFLTEDSVDALEQGERRSVKATVGAVDPNGQWAYLNIADINEVHNLDDVAYIDDEGNVRVDYDDLQEAITPCTMSQQVTSFPEDLSTGDLVDVEISLSYDDDGNRWLNAIRFYGVVRAQRDEGATFDPEAVAEKKGTIPEERE